MNIHLENAFEQLYDYIDGKEMDDIDIHKLYISVIKADYIQALKRISNLQYDDIYVRSFLREIKALIKAKAGI